MIIDQYKKMKNLFLRQSYSIYHIADSHDFIPAIQMCVCLDKAGRHREAFEFHKKARVLKPLHQAVIGNEKYFRDVWGME